MCTNLKLTQISADNHFRWLVWLDGFMIQVHFKQISISMLQQQICMGKRHTLTNMSLHDGIQTSPALLPMSTLNNLSRC